MTDWTQAASVSTTQRVDPLQFSALLQQQGWTDGRLMTVGPDSAGTTTIYAFATQAQLNAALAAYSYDPWYGKPMFSEVSTWRLVAGAPVTTTASVSVSHAVPEAGLYLVSGVVNVANGTSGQPVVASVTYTSALDSQQHTVYLVADPAVGDHHFDGSTSIPNGEYPLHTVLLHLAGGSTVTMTYHDPGGTPNDKLSAALIRVG